LIKKTETEKPFREILNDIDETEHFYETPVDQLFRENLEKAGIMSEDKEEEIIEQR
jgi:hypothetical protein